jgi:hypothetical protein
MVLAYVREDSDSDCWLWTGQVSNSGHGRIKIKDESELIKMQSAEHVSYMAFIGEIPAGHFARQTCNNRLCVNPKHLELCSETQL